MRGLITSAVLLAALTAQAGPFDRGFDTVPIKITPTSRSLLALDGAEMHPPKSFLIQAYLDANIGVLGLKLSQDKIGDLIPFRLDLHLMGAYQLFDWLELAVDIPFTVGQVSGFQLLRDQGFVDEGDVKAGGLNDWRFLGRFRIFSQAEFPVALGAVAEVRIPIGDGYSFLGDNGLVFHPRGIVERRFGPLRLVLNLGWRLRTAAAQYLNVYVGQEFVSGLGAGVELPNFGTFSHNEILAEVNLATPAEAPFTFKDAESLKTPFEAMLGMRSTVHKNWGVHLSFGKGLGLQSGYGRELFRITAGVRYEDIAEPDRDGDGIPDRIDKCPDTPEDLDGDEDTDGCPEPDKDRDGDSIVDRVDGCIDTPGPAEYDGCPDRDGDQIPDNVDKCPDEPGAPETEGCPVPEEEEVVLESDRIRIRGNILFETGQAIIQKQSYKLLDDVAKVLKDNPDVGPVLIEGHTDNRGSHAYNLDLSNRRAAAVEDYLVKQGIAKKRLRSKGFSFDRPIATNDTPLGRAKNRRTEFRLIDEEPNEKK